MAFAEITALLGGWPGFELIAVKREEATQEHTTPRIVLTLEACRVTRRRVVGAAPR